MSTGVYENLPLTPLNKEEKENLTTDASEEVSGTNNIKTLQNTLYNTNSNQNNSKSPTMDGDKTSSFQNNIPKTRSKVSRSIAEIFFKSGKRGKKANAQNQNAHKDKTNANEVVQATTNEDKLTVVVEKRDDDSSKSSEGVEEDKKVCQKSGNQHSTPTSTFDDGYESCNSTPLGSGKEKIFMSCVIFIRKLSFDLK